LIASYLRLDNAGKNKLLEAMQKQTSFEFTAKDTPHHNHMAELGFGTPPLSRIIRDRY